MRQKDARDFDRDMIAYGKTPLGQYIYDIGFTKLDEKYLARKHRKPVATVRLDRKVFLHSMKAEQKRNRK